MTYNPSKPLFQIEFQLNLSKLKKYDAIIGSFGSTTYNLESQETRDTKNSDLQVVSHYQQSREMEKDIHYHCTSFS